MDKLYCIYCGSANTINEYDSTGLTVTCKTCVQSFNVTPSADDDAHVEQYNDAMVDCFGASNYDPEDDPEERAEFEQYVRGSAVIKTCVGCGRRVKLLPHYDVCDSCADKREKGWDI